MVDNLRDAKIKGCARYCDDAGGGSAGKNRQKEHPPIKVLKREVGYIWEQKTSNKNRTGEGSSKG